MSPATSKGWPLKSSLAVACLVVHALAPSSANAAAPPAPPKTPRQAAVIDLTGYWVSVVTEDWRFRMVVPSRGDYASVPLNDAARRIADNWDPEADARNGDACKAYGVGNLMRMPTRLHVTWTDDDTMQIETDAGKQTRTLEFPPSTPNAAPTLQGTSRAQWDNTTTLKVVTTGMTPGYLRRNGVPYSDQAVVTEYFVRHASAGIEWLTVTTVVNDPVYLREEFITNSDFKKLPDTRNGWTPSECVSEWGPLKIMGFDPFFL